jgi:hypothetical protein
MDPFQYDILPEAFRNQVIHIWEKTIGAFNKPSYRGGPIERARSQSMADHSFPNQAWKEMYDTFIEERGVSHLTTKGDNPFEQFKSYLLTADTDGALEAIALTFRMINLMRPGSRLRFDEAEYAISNMSLSADAAIDRLNQRFREHGLGYQFVEGQVVRVDSGYMHAQATKPAMTILHEERFEGASQEFSSAHEHYREGRFKEAIVDALKAFESTMKTICEERNWAYSSTAQAKDLIKVVFDKGLVPSSLLSHFTALRSVMESGLPTVRNKTSGHGQGSTPLEVPEYLAAYALQLAAANILLMVNAHKSMN